MKMQLTVKLSLDYRDVNNSNLQSRELDGNCG